MGELTQTALAIIFASVLVGIFAVSLYNSSTDVNKVPFNTYQQAKNLSTINNGNFTYSDTNNTESNFLLIAENMQQTLAQATQQANSGNPADVILGAFGVLSALTIGMGQILLGIFIQGWNFLYGLNANLSLLPAPWYALGVTAFTLAFVLFAVYITFKTIAFITGRFQL